MQATAQFVPDFMTQLVDAKQASLDALGGDRPEHYALCAMGPRNVAFFDALHYVETNFPNCDRRRRKREWRKALKQAYAGELPKIMVTLTPEPIELGNTFDTVTMKGNVGAGRWPMIGDGERVITWSQRPGEIVDLSSERS